MQIVLLSNLMLTSRGLISSYDQRVNEDNSRVFLKQGDLDGACGIYALMMSLIAIGTLSRADVMRIWEDRPDGRTILGKVTKQLGALTQDGLTAEQLIDLFNAIKLSEYQRKPSTRLASFNLIPLDVSGVSAKVIIHETLARNMPVIIRLEWEKGGAHWVTVIGYQTYGDNIENFLILDPGAESDTASAWNGVLRFDREKKGPRPYLYWGRGIPTAYCSISIGAIFDKCME